MSLLDNKQHLFTVICEKSGNGLFVKYYENKNCIGTRGTSASGWNTPPMLILGGNVAPTYDEVRVYSRALTHAEVVDSVDLGPEKLPKAPAAAVPAAPQPSAAATPNATGKTLKAACLHRWSFTDNMVDSIDHMSPSSSKDAQVANGSVALKSGSPLLFPTGAVPVAPFTVQVWASASGRDLVKGRDMILKIAPSIDADETSVHWRWTAGNRWASSIRALNPWKNTTYGKQLSDGNKRLYTIIGEKANGGLAVKFYLNDTCEGAMTGNVKTGNPPWTKPQMLILGGTVNAVYDEVRVYSRALSHAEIVDSLNLGPDKMP